MNPFINPIFLANTIKSYCLDIGRLERLDEKQLEKYRNKVFRKTVKYAYTVPLYHKKYRAAGIHPTDIRSINDITKLPFITKKDLRKNFPDGIISTGFNKEKNFLLSTSGSTGKPISIYRDMSAITHDLWGFIRELKIYGISWWRNRISLIADLTPNTAGTAYTAFNTNKQTKAPFISFKNIQTLDIGENINTLMKKLNTFKPEFLSGYPDILQGFAILKRKGYGENVQPQVIQSVGAMLSDYTRDYIEKTFNCHVFDAYSSTEAGPSIFECLEGSYHVHDDFIHLEFVDDDMMQVPMGKQGHVVITRLHAGGSPIIRYTGNDDIIIPLEGGCKCGIKSSLIKKIEGRKIDSLILPDGKIIPPLSITGIPYTVMQELKTDKIQQFQIIQRKLDEIDILVVIDEESGDKKPPVKSILKELKNRYQEKLGKNITINVKEVDRVEKTGAGNGIVKEVISLVKKTL